jgi:hypothetical protein
MSVGRVSFVVILLLVLLLADALDCADDDEDDAEVPGVGIRLLKPRIGIRDCVSWNEMKKKNFIRVEFSVF